MLDDTLPAPTGAISPGSSAFLQGNSRDPYPATACAYLYDQPNFGGHTLLLPKGVSINELGSWVGLHRPRSAIVYKGCALTGLVSVGGILKGVLYGPPSLSMTGARPFPNINADAAIPSSRALKCDCNVAVANNVRGLVTFLGGVWGTNVLPVLDDTWTAIPPTVRLADGLGGAHLLGVEVSLSAIAFYARGTAAELTSIQVVVPPRPNAREVHRYVTIPADSDGVFRWNAIKVYYQDRADLHGCGPDSCYVTPTCTGTSIDGRTHSLPDCYHRQGARSYCKGYAAGSVCIRFDDFGKGFFPTVSPAP